MKVFLDGMPVLGQKTGVGYYVHNLYKHLNELCEIDVGMLGNGLGCRKIKNTDSGPVLKIGYPYDLIRTLPLLKSLYHQIKLDWFIGDFDIFHGTNYTVLPTVRAKKVVTIHDLSFIKVPEHVPPKILQHHREWVQYSVRHADSIIVDSLSVKEEVCDYYKVSPEIVYPIYLGPSGLTDIGEERQFQVLNNIPEQYILYVGSIESRKNISGLVKAYANAKKKHGFPHKLVLAGGLGFKYKEILETINQLDLRNDIVILGYVEDFVLSRLYSKASLFIYVSYYEGFGIPLVDALKAGLPIITSRLSSMPEVVGDAGVLINPHDIEELSNEIGKLLTNNEACVELRNKSRIQADKFNWTITAAETYQIYNKTINNF